MLFAVREPHSHVVQLAIAVCISIKRDATREVALEAGEQRHIFLRRYGDRAANARRVRPVQVSEPDRDVESNERFGLCAAELEAARISSEPHGWRCRTEQ